MNFENVLKKFTESGATTGMASGLLGGLAGSLLMSKSGRKLGKNALKLGGVAAVGALAYGAYKKYTNTQDGNSNPRSSNDVSDSIDESKFMPAETTSESSDINLELLLAKAMIAASRADGRVEVEESQIIINQIRSFNLAEEYEFQLMHQFNQPSDIDELVSEAKTIEIATEVYAVSLLVIDQANETETSYLAKLADQLKLPNALVDAIENEVNENRHKLAA